MRDRIVEMARPLIKNNLTGSFGVFFMVMVSIGSGLLVFSVIRSRLCSFRWSLWWMFSRRFSEQCVLFICLVYMVWMEVMSCERYVFEYIIYIRFCGSNLRWDEMHELFGNILEKKVYNSSKRVIFQYEMILRKIEYFMKFKYCFRTEHFEKLIKILYRIALFIFEKSSLKIYIVIVWKSKFSTATNFFLDFMNIIISVIEN